ncbi:MAG: SOS response-associated peptidase [Comamonas sp.]
MCNRYVSPGRADIERIWGIGRRSPHPDKGRELRPLGLGPFVRRGADRRREVVVGQWGMIAPRSRTRELRTAEGRRLSTHHARIEGIAAKWAFRNAWRRGQRCLIPAESFDLPCWETGHEVWWTFRRADGQPWALAGLWSEWKDPVSGEIVPSYTMVTENCDEHPLLGRMHKPDPRLPPERQDKRAAVPIEPEDWDRWLGGSIGDAYALIDLPPPERILAVPSAR